MTKMGIIKIESLDFIFENSPVRIVANRSCPQIELAGLSVGPFEEGAEYEICHWIASELVKSGLAHFHAEDQLDVAKLGKIQWTERVQTAGQISKLPDGFYPQLRRCLVEMRDGVGNSPEKMREYERAGHLARDIVNSRLKKIVSIASASAQSESGLRNLAGEERLLYEKLFRVINQWKTLILEHKEGT